MDKTHKKNNTVAKNFEKAYKIADNNLFFRVNMMVTACISIPVLVLLFLEKLPSDTFMLTAEVIVIIQFHITMSVVILRSFRV